MGNRAYVRVNGTNRGVYLQWNGGRDSIEAFLRYCKERNFRGFEDSYGMARFCQVVGNFFGGGLSIGVEFDINDADAKWCDNGIYDVKGWDIVGRVFEGAEQHNYDMTEMLINIDECQPKSEQLGKDYFTAPLVKKEDIKVGDLVIVRDWDGKVIIDKVIGTLDDGTPYIGHWCTETLPAKENVNNYLKDAEYKVIMNVA